MARRRPKPGKGIKCGDHLTAPMCRLHHDHRETKTGVFKGWTEEQMQVFCDDAMARAAAALDWEAVGGGLKAAVPW